MDVTSEALVTYKEDRLKGQGLFKKPAMVGTVNKELTQIVTILNMACRDLDWIPRVPRIRHVRGPTKDPYPITYDEQERLFGKLPTGWDVGAALFAINTGVRKSELFGLKWSHKVVLSWMEDGKEAETFVFILSDTKNGEDRAVICNSVARRVVNHMREARKMWRREIARLEAQLADGALAGVAAKRARTRIEGRRRALKSGLVFPSATGLRITSVAKVFNKAWMAAGLPDQKYVKKGIHNLRHSFGHRLRAVGVPDEDRDALLGHAKKSLTQHYATPDIQRLQAMAERVVERRETVVLRSIRSAI
jgi:integrase